MDITGDLEIIGAGASSATLDGAHLDRVIHIVSGLVKISGVTITGGVATASNGGGILSGGALELERTTISGNTALANSSGIAGNGGGVNSVGLTASNWLTVVSSTVSGNTAVLGGGVSSNSILTVRNSTIANNTATIAGGGIRAVNSAMIENSTVSGNTAPNSAGGIVRITSWPIQIKNSIIAENTAAYGPNCYAAAGAPTSLGGNVSNDTSCGVGPGDKVVTSAMLSPLSYNGGPTQTMLPQAGSPAIDAATDCTDVAGTAISTDQRGYSRNPAPGGACDSGAVEVNAPTPIGQLTIYKSMTIAPSPLPVSTGPWPNTTTFVIRADCGGPWVQWAFRPPPQVLQLQSSFAPQPYGTVCTVKEIALPPPFTDSSGNTCTWQQQAPLIQKLTITNPSHSVTVTNTLTCTPPPPTGTLSIYKLILDPSGNPLVFAGPWGLSAPSFNIRANCGGQGPGSVSLTPPILAGSIPNLPYGTTCTIDEPALPSPFTNSAGDTCTWQQSAPLSQSIPINGPAQSVTVTNTFTCAPPAPTTASIRLHKSLAHPPGVMAPTGVTYDVTVTCGTSSQTLPIPTGGTPGYATTQQFLVGSSCTIQETLPSKCSWGSITYRYQLGPSAPVQTYVGNTLAFNLSGMAAIDIENTLLAACP